MPPINLATHQEKDEVRLFTLLHISDLHRSPHDPIENPQLIGALLSDRDRYLAETPQVNTPDAAIVSGDIIQGVTLNTPEYAKELQRQYDVAFDFLGELAERFFQGDRSKIVLVPGNHDICWNTSRNAMTTLAPEPKELKVNQELFQAASDYRWDWKTRTILQVTDKALYQKRLDLYWDFVEKFYYSAKLKHPINRVRGFNLFELNEGKIVVAAFESIHGNDCFCRQGALERSAIGNCALAIRDLPRQPILRIATWHHSFQGPPQGDDYMDIASVQEMIGSGFRLGLHGHQHQADASAYAIHLPEKHSIAISSAGSLCAGARELPRGTNREYNLVAIGDTYAAARIHVREMTQGNHFGRCGRGVFRVDGFSELEWELPVASIGGGPITNATFDALTVLRAEEELHAGRATEALSLLEEIREPLAAHARTLYIEAARSSENNQALIKFLSPPKSISEFIELFGALLAEDEIGEAGRLLGSSAELGIDPATSASLNLKMKMRLMMGSNK